jgi:hypothetical protein
MRSFDGTKTASAARRYRWEWGDGIADTSAGLNLMLPISTNFE